jgi:hypothetical protein
MTCTDCNKITHKTITDVWNSTQGQIVEEHEHLCIECAELRGYKSLSQLNDQRK